MAAKMAAKMATIYIICSYLPYPTFYHFDFDVQIYVCQGKESICTIKFCIGLVNAKVAAINIIANIYNALYEGTHFNIYINKGMVKQVDLGSTCHGRFCAKLYYINMQIRVCLSRFSTKSSMVLLQ